MSWFTTLHESLQQALAVVLPVSCAGCGVFDTVLCSACHEEILVEHSDQALACGVDQPVIAATAYSGSMRDAILKYKEEGQTSLAPVLAPYLMDALGELVRVQHHALGPCFPDTIQLVVAPQTPAAQRKRGYHPVEVLVRKGGFRPSRLLSFARIPKDQGHLDSASRAQNMHGSFLARGDLSGTAVIILDDVLTTGATIREMQRALSAAGAWVLGAAVLSYSPLKKMNFSSQDDRLNNSYYG